MTINLKNLHVGDTVQIDCESGLGTGSKSKITKFTTELIVTKMDGNIVKDSEVCDVVWVGDHAFESNTGYAINEPTAYRITRVLSKEFHPVRFTYDDIAFLKHMFLEVGYDYFEEECYALLRKIEKSEEEEN